jgi:hypothetical protein
MQHTQSCDILALAAMDNISDYSLVSADKTYKKVWQIDPIWKMTCGRIDSNENFIEGEQNNVTIKYNSKANILKYTGPLKNGKKHGEGVEYYANGDIYQGSFEDDFKHGQGKLYFKNMSLKYAGEWRNDQLLGSFVGYLVNDKNEQCYYGQISNQQANGLGARIANGKFVGCAIYKDGEHEEALAFTENYIPRIVRKNADINTIKKLIEQFVNDVNLDNLAYLKKYFIPTKSPSIDVQTYDEKGNLVIDGTIKIASNDIKIHGEAIYNHSLMRIEGTFEDSYFIKGTIANPLTREVLCEGTFDKLHINFLTKKTDCRKHLITGTVTCMFKLPGDRTKTMCKFEGTFKNHTFERGILYKMVDNRQIKYYDGEFDTNTQVFIENMGTIDKAPIAGEGIEYFDNGNTCYSGSWKNGLYHGYGQYYNRDNFAMEYIGNFGNGIRHGQGVILNIDGTIVYEGQFTNGDF